MSTVYRDRTEAGELLAERLASLARQPDAVVLGLVRGGVLTAAAVARRLDLPLDVLVVRKLGVPFAPELAFGAMGPGGVKVFNEQIASRIDPDEIDQVVRKESAELARRERRFRANRPPLDLVGKTAVIVDDGLATGATARAAVAVARHLGARRVVVAAPVGAADAYQMLAREADEVIGLDRPTDFGSVGSYYEDFHEVTDEEAVAVLNGTA